MTEAADFTGAEQRMQGPRLRCLLTGMLVMDNLTTMECRVRNISAFGARVETSEAFRLPATFDLRIPHHSAVHRARVIWRSGAAAGLALSDLSDEAGESGRGSGRGRRKRRYPV